MKVSIIVTAYNIGKYLEKCLQSLLKTSPYISEIICVDDGSTDNSYAIICKYKKIDPRIIAIHKENGGISSARNKGIQIASGDFLIFVDGDDYIDVDILNSLLDKYYWLLNSEAMTTIWCGYTREDWNGEYGVNPIFDARCYDRGEIVEHILPSFLGISYQKLYKWFKGDGLQKNQEFPSVWRAVYSKRIIDSNNISFNEDVQTGEDLLFNWEYFAYADNIQISDTKYYHYIWRKGSLTQNTSEHFYMAKKAMEENRDIQNKRLIEVTGDLSNEYQGSLILSKIQMAIMLSNCSLKNLIKHYKMFVDYGRMSSIVNAYKKLKLKDAPLKYKVPLYMAEKQCNLLLFLGCFILSKLKIQIYPED